MDAWFNEIIDVCIYGLCPVLIALFLFAIEIVNKIKD